MVIRTDPVQHQDSKTSSCQGQSSDPSDVRPFVLVTGPTGSGKSTTLAAMIDPSTRVSRVIQSPSKTDRIHPQAPGLHREPAEVGADTKSFGHALKYALRQDPDVVLVGEMRDLEHDPRRHHHRRLAGLRTLHTKLQRTINRYHRVSRRQPQCARWRSVSKASSRRPAAEAKEGPRSGDPRLYGPIRARSSRDIHLYS